MIVESPAKAKTIEKYLGDDFKVTSCYGHVRDLPKHEMGIDIDNKYTPNYEVTDDKKDLVKQLKKDATTTDEVWLATDEDREGEAISWHLCAVLGLQPEKAKRIVFHEITKPAILKAVSKPRQLDINLVNAQQARRVLDRLVGYKLSPVLRRKISLQGSLSAGRVQSVAVRLVVEREAEILAFETKSVFKITAFFTVNDTSGKAVTFKAESTKNFDDAQGAEVFLQQCIGANYTVSDIRVKPGKKSPPPPFTTSTLQQDASRKLGFSVQRTMSVAQRLYEAGHITYMRTDSTNLSEIALGAAAQTIEDQYGNKYVQIRQYATKSASAQEAHEAIRPTYFNNDSAGNNNDEKRLYELIYKRTLASQMADALLERTNVDILISTKPDALLQAKGEVIKFDGFLALYRETALDEESEEEQSAILPPLKLQQNLPLKEMLATERFNRPPARYNEATLVKKLEELSIGRPSTYAPTISKIQERGYVVREDREGVQRNYQQFVLSGKKPQMIVKQTLTERIGVEKAKLFPTDVGKIIVDFLVTHFQNVFEYNFTANIEKQFDEIAQGNKEWTKMIDTFYQPFSKQVEDTLQTAERMKAERALGTDPKTGKPITAKLGKYGPMIQIGQVEDEDKPLFATIRPPYTIQNITLEQALDLFKLPRSLGDYEGKEVKVNEGRFGPYIQHDGKFTSIPKLYDLWALTLQQAIELINGKRESDANKIVKDFPDLGYQILTGRWGAYIKSGKLNVKIPKGTDAKALTAQDCQALVKAAQTAAASSNPNLIKDFPEIEAQILKGRFGAYIKVGETNLKMPKGQTPETITQDDIAELIKANQSKPKKTITNTKKSKTTPAAKAPKSKPTVKQ